MSAVNTNVQKVKIMKKLFACILVGMGMGVHAQTATNWTVTDCSGASHELFADLDAGKVAVIIWVMPCANCINKALETQTEVRNALAANAGKVVFYLADDIGNTNCSTMETWASQNAITDAIVITSKAVSMKPYGEAGMPKVLVAGGSEHKVFYNQNAPNITANGIRDGISAALAAPTGIEKNILQEMPVTLFPNPSGNSTRIKINVVKETKYKIDVVNVAGQVVSKITDGNLSAGAIEFTVDTSLLADGTYFISIDNGDKKIQEKLIVAH
jgi:hypothetical protein